MDASRPRSASSVLALLLAAVLSFAGCSGGETDARLIDYQHRLAETLGVAPPESRSPANIAAFPGPDDRLFEIAETRQGLLAVYALRECRITSLVARRNAPLGRLAAPSQRWLYELRLWRRLRACLEGGVPATLADDDRHRLARLTATKTTQLPRASWNALFGSEEWVGSFSRASTPLPLQDADVPWQPALAALSYLRRATLAQFDPDWQPESSVLEGHLKALAEQPLTARVLRSLLLVTRRLDEASDLLHSSREQAVCPPLATLEAPAPLVAAGLEEPIEALAQRAQAWLAAVDALLDAHSVSRPAIEEYRHDWLSLKNPRAPWPAFNAARRRHRLAWTQLVRSCPPPADERET